MKAKELAEILNRVPDADVVIYDDSHGGRQLLAVTLYASLERLEKRCGIVEDEITAPAILLSPFSS